MSPRVSSASCLLAELLHGLSLAVGFPKHKGCRTAQIAAQHRFSNLRGAGRASKRKQARRFSWLA